jgi:hypothetical protein
MNKILGHLWRWVAGGLLLGALAYASLRLLAGLEELPPSSGPRWLNVASIIAWSFATAAAVAWPALRSRWAGSQLMCAICVAVFGVYAGSLVVVPEVITLSRAALLMAQWLLLTVPFSLVLVVVLGRLRGQELMPEGPRLHLPAGEMLWKLGLCTAVFMALYVAGELALRPLVEDFYSEQGRLGEAERLILQAGRALLAVVFVLPIIKMMRGGRVEAALCLGCLLCMVGGLAPMLIAYGFLPMHVRFAYAAEEGLSQFIYGALAGYLFSRIEQP